MAKNASADVKIRPLGDRVLVQVEEAGEETSPSGIIVPEAANDERQDRGTVIAVGPGKRGDDNELVPVAVKEGDTVLFQWGDKIEYAGQEYYLVAEGNLLAVVD
ncbi:co-chaperone GroES [Patescibacteria group bacterium]|jgi:chaperonin GroES|nr:co-chaperone GroES [Patescibacteria group bacterium]